MTSIDSISQIQFGHRQFPQIRVLRNGDWLVSFCWTEDAYFAKSAFLRSTDRGRTWNEEGCGLESGCLIELRDGSLAFIDSFYPLHKGGDEFVMQACFAPDGRTFGRVQYDIPLHCPDAQVISLAEMMRNYFALPCFPWNRFFKANGYPAIAPGWPETAKRIFFGGAGPAQTVELSDGRLVSMSYCLGRRGASTPPGYTFSYALESADRGRSWRQIGSVPWSAEFEGEGALFGSTGFTEAGLAELADGVLLIVLRAGSGMPMAMSRSADGGRTWSQPSRIPLEDSGELARGVYPVLIRMTTGALACVYGRPGIHLMTDATGTGQHWRHEIDLRAVESDLCVRRGAASADFQSTENVGLAEVAPGELAITYDLWGWTESAAAPSVRQTIRLARMIRR